MTPIEQLGDRELIDLACKELGVKVGELAVMLKFKSLPRYRNGEFPLTQQRRQHIQDLLMVHKSRIPADLIEAKAMPTHHVPPERENRIKDEGALFGKPLVSEIDFAGCIKMLTELHDRDPAAFRAAAQMIKGLYGGLK